jgi:uridine kinase
MKGYSGNLREGWRFITFMSALDSDISKALSAILKLRGSKDANQALLVGVSGIDGSGKGFVADRIVATLLARQVRAVLIHGDGWLNLPEKRFHPLNAGQHFYEHAFRMDDMFERFILPLKRNRSHHGVMDFAEETATAYRVEPFSFQDVDVIVLECIFLFKRRYRRHCDLAIWIDCSFETALERAIQRGQEGLPPAEAVHAYETIYFPAQRIHFDEDRPRGTADVIVDNDGNDFRTRRPSSTDKRTP